MADMTVYELDPDARFLRVMEDYSAGKATREDVSTAIALAMDVPLASWRPETLHRYAFLMMLHTTPDELDAMLELALSYGVTVKSPRGVQ